MRTRTGADRLPGGLTALGGFFALGAVIASLAGLALLVPGSGLEPMWPLNPAAGVALRRMGPWAIVLMVDVGVLCALSAAGLWIRARWGHRLALALLAANLVGDTANALIRGDLRTLIGLPIGGVLIAYLMRAGVRAQYGETRPDAKRPSSPA